jgi:hypothetical protein
MNILGYDIFLPNRDSNLELPKYESGLLFGLQTLGQNAIVIPVLIRNKAYFT